MSMNNKNSVSRSVNPAPPLELAQPQRTQNSAPSFHRVLGSSTTPLTMQPDVSALTQLRQQRVIDQLRTRLNIAPPLPAQSGGIPRRTQAQPEQSLAFVPSPRDNFAVEGATAQARFANYLHHPWHSQHTDQLFTTYQKEWAGIACWVFPLSETPKANRFAPKLDDQIKNYLNQDTTARANQYKTLDAILGHYGIKRTDAHFAVEPNFSRQCCLFNHTNGNAAPLVMTRIIRHLASTGRMHHAKNLQQLLVSQALQARNEQLAAKKPISITNATLAHWLYSTQEDYFALVTSMQPVQLHRDLQLLASQPISQPQRAGQRSVILQPPAPPAHQPVAAFNHVGNAGKTRWNRPLLKVEGTGRNVPQYLDITSEEILDEAQQGLSQRTDLNRFTRAHRGDEHFGQGKDLLTALHELKAGKKKTHWIWYIFPQIRGLGFSAPNQYYAIHNLADAQRYLNDPSLKHALESAIKAAIDSSLRQNRTAHDIFGADHAKVWSSLTLFAVAGNMEAQRGLQHFFSNITEPNTRRLLAIQSTLSGAAHVQSPSQSRGDRQAVQPHSAASTRAQKGNGNAPWSTQNKDGFLPINIPFGAYNYAAGITPILNTPRQAPPLDNTRPLAHVDIASADIATAKEQIVVNASNLALTKGGGVDGVIHRKAGASLQAELNARYNRIGQGVSCYTSQACATHPHGFAANGVHYLIHVTGPDVRPAGVASYPEPYAPAFDGNNWRKDEPKAKRYLQLAYRNVLDKALSLNARSVCLPLLSSGIFQYPANAAAAAALEVCKEDHYKGLKIVFYTGNPGSEADKALRSAKQKLNK